MFTGIVEEMGTIRSIRRGAHSGVLSIGAELVLSDLKIGDSVAVNGVSGIGPFFCLYHSSHGGSHHPGPKTGGDIVNLETDIIGKYVEKLLRPRAEQPRSGGISLEFLVSNEF